MRWKHQEGRGQIHNLSEEPANLLGMLLTWDGNRMRYAMEEEAWQHLREGLSEAYDYPEPTKAMEIKLRGWIEAFAPAFERYEEQQLLMIRDVLDALGFQEASLGILRSWIHSARDKWISLRRKKGLED
jgi:hypothetical protein